MWGKQAKAMRIFEPWALNSDHCKIGGVLIDLERSIKHFEKRR